MTLINLAHNKPSNQSSSLIFSPQVDFDLTTYLENSRHLIESSLPSLPVVYIRNITLLHPFLRSLTLDQSGQIWVSSRSTNWVAEQIFKATGFTYQKWSHFLQATTKQPRTIFPYVHGNLIFYRIPNKIEHHPDWINASLCSQMICSKRKGEHPIELFIPSNINAHLNIRIPIHFRKSIILKQVDSSYHLSNLWNHHYNQQLSCLHYQLDVNNPTDRQNHFFQDYPFNFKHDFPINSQHLIDFSQSLLTPLK